MCRWHAAIGDMGGGQKMPKRHSPRAGKRAASRSGPAPGNGSAGPPFLVAGLGASAGGLEAFSLVLRSIPATAPLALVLVQHLARDHKSLLAELLAAKTDLVVME